MVRGALWAGRHLRSRAAVLRVRGPPWTRAGGGIWQTHLAQNETPRAWEFESPPAHQLCTRPDGDGSSLQNCDSGFNSSRVSHVGDAEAVEATVRKTVLTGFESRLSLHRRARSDGNAFWSRKPALRERPGWRFDSSALRHHIKVLAFSRPLP